MIDDSKDLGDFSEWIERINQSFEKADTCDFSSDSEAFNSNDDVSMSKIMETLKEWLKQVEEAPITTWKEELSVRGFEFSIDASEEDQVVSNKLDQLIHSLAGMRVFLSNTDHLNDRQLFNVLVERYLVMPVAQIPFDNSGGCVIDIVGSEVEEDPSNWLRYYANSRERMEWAKQNVGKTLPPSEKPPHSRENRLPKP